MHYQNLGSRLKFSRHTFHILLILSVTKNHFMCYVTVKKNIIPTRKKVDKFYFMRLLKLKFKTFTFASKNSYNLTCSLRKNGRLNKKFI